MKIKFRSAEISDIQAMIEVQNRSFIEDYKKHGVCPAYDESSDDLATSIEEGIVYMIEYDGEIVGDIILYKMSPVHCHIQVVCVVPEYHNLGIGKLAMKHIEEDNPTVKCWTLSTTSNSYRNHHFYKKLGYEKSGEFSHSDKLVMFEYVKKVDG